MPLLEFDEVLRYSGPRPSRPRPPRPHQPGKGDADHGLAAAGSGDSGGDFVPAAGGARKGSDHRTAITRGKGEFELDHTDRHMEKDITINQLVYDCVDSGRAILLPNIGRLSEYNVRTPVEYSSTLYSPGTQYVT